MLPARWGKGVGWKVDKCQNATEDAIISGCKCCYWMIIIPIHLCHPFQHFILGDCASDNLNFLQLFIPSTDELINIDAFEKMIF